MKKITFSLFALLLFIGHGFAQNKYFGFQIKAYQPQAGFAENIDETPIGFSMNFLSDVKESPLSVGFEGGFASYNCTEGTINYKGQEIEIMEDDGFINFHGLLRYNFLDFGWSQVYGEGKIGITSFFSSTSAMDCESEYAGTFNFHGTAFNVGFGGGVLINPTIFAGYDEDNILLIDLGVNSYRGSTSTYSINSEKAPDQSPTMSSFTDYIDYRIGIVFKLQ